MSSSILDYGTIKKHESNPLTALILLTRYSNSYVLRLLPQYCCNNNDTRVVDVMTIQKNKKLNLYSIYSHIHVRYKQPPIVIYAQLDKANAPRCEQDAPRNGKKINFAVRSTIVLSWLPLDPQRLGIN